MSTELREASKPGFRLGLELRQFFQKLSNGFTHPVLAHRWSTKRRSRFLSLVCAAVVLALILLFCVRLGFDHATAAFALLVVIAILSYRAGFSTSFAFLVVAYLCLSYFIVDPAFSFRVGNPQHAVLLATFLISSLFVSSLIWRIQTLDSMHLEQARLLDLTTDAVIVRDSEDVITYWNRGAEALYGWRREEAIGKVEHLLLKTEFPEPIHNLRQMLALTGRWEGELVHTTRSGARILVLSRWSSRHEQPDTSGTIACNTDVTQRRAAEKAARQSQAAYIAEAQKLSKTGSFGWNIATNHLVWSAETFRIFELPSLSMPTMDFVFQRIHPDDLNAVRTAVTDAQESGNGFSLEHRLLMPDGTVKFLRLKAHPMTNPDSPPEFVGVVMDISEQKRAHVELVKSEQRYRQLFSRMPIALRQLDATKLVQIFRQLRQDGVTDLGPYFEANPGFLQTCMEALTFREANEHAIQMFGGNASESSPVSLVRTWEARPDTFRRAMESRFRGEPSFEEETKMVTWDGRVIDVLFITARVGRVHDYEMSLVGTIDISERIRAQDSLRKLQADFAHAARVSMLGELTASIAHEINQPLAVISTSGSAGLRWLDRPQPALDEVRSSIGAILASSQRAANIVARVRAMAAGQSTARSLVLVDEVIAEALLFLQHEIQMQRVTMTFHKNASSVRALCDRTQLQQIIVNLAMNAMQAMEGAGIRSRRIIITSGCPSPGRILLRI
ncbi:PAS domain S-box protein [Bradyrhizobium sp. CCBAU 25338]|uniref:PAS domain S-box protein n=1 Tax=Bradyrhizobium sp. CCBAU 25338 TaxID=1641877 RepID=UPI00230232AA|nr:PAS domain S-box protein [Bradyrhizobium sp. CCBAU 25338]